MGVGFGMKIAIFCGANLGHYPIYEEKSLMLADWMASREYDLVFGGGKVGLMGVMADRMIAHGRETIGVMPIFLQEREIAHAGLSQLIIVSDMHERKAKMMDLSQAFIALPGGPGTLEEISEVISWSRVGQNDGPCIFYNINGYYDSLQAMFEHMVEQGFLSQADREKVLFTDNLAEIETFIQNYETPSIREY